MRVACGVWRVSRRLPAARETAQGPFGPVGDATMVQTSPESLDHCIRMMVCCSHCSWLALVDESDGTRANGDAPDKELLNGGQCEEP